LRKLPDDQRLDVRSWSFLVIKIRADVPDVRIRETNDLSGIAWVGENFLITGETGIENDFAATARDGAGSAAVKYAPVFQRENGGPMLNFVQVVLR
jgi:hypothetical protein